VGIALAKEMISRNEIRIRKPLGNEPPRIVPFALARQDDVRVLILIARVKIAVNKCRTQHQKIPSGIAANIL
jgi:hypothetical protein